MKEIKDFLEVKEEDFNEEALKVFNFQYANNKVYKEYVDALDIKPEEVDKIEQIPFLPVRLFKTKRVITYSQSRDLEPEKIFTSSSTTGMTPSKHYVMDLEMYRKSFINSFEYFYGKIEGAAVLALLPSYLEREGSSLIYMVDEFIKSSKNPDSGYYLYNHEDLYQKLIKLKQEGRKTILFGVTFALLDFAEKFSLEENDWELLIFETGGMKGRRKEISRDELHKTLKKAFNVKNIHSEYGMCELLSQAYSKGQGIFNTPPWMKIVLRDINDPLSLKTYNGKQIEDQKINMNKDSSGNITGVINIIDLANLYSCAFISTDDKGTILSDGSFTIDGRLSNAERRGCNMLIE